MGIDIDSNRPIIGHCSKCGEARDDEYTCRNGGSTVPAQPKPGGRSDELLPQGES